MFKVHLGSCGLQIPKVKPKQLDHPLVAGCSIAHKLKDGFCHFPKKDHVIGVALLSFSLAVRVVC